MVLLASTAFQSQTFKASKSLLMDIKHSGHFPLLLKSSLKEQVETIVVMAFKYGAGPWQALPAPLPAGSSRSPQSPYDRVHISYHPPVPGKWVWCSGGLAGLEATYCLPKGSIESCKNIPTDILQPYVLEKKAVSLWECRGRNEIHVC